LGLSSFLFFSFFFDTAWNKLSLCLEVSSKQRLVKIQFFYKKLIFYIFFYFNMLELKIKKNYFNIFLNKKHLKKNTILPKFSHMSLIFCNCMFMMLLLCEIRGPGK
jgi:hypothetical protein